VSAAPIRLETVTGAALRRHLPALARLRAEVFRSWPYLYQTEPEYEVGYLETYAASPGAGLVLAMQEGEAVGASTCMKLSDETANVQAPFLARGLDPARFCYFGESVLLPAFRGRGLGVGFFQRREAHAMSLGAEFACFCAVERPLDHPARPAAATTLDAFWHKRGFARRPDLVCEMRWRDVGAAEQTSKTMVFWLKSLRGAALP
jgi:GNAT superfamily N-acetyltransferase